MRKLVRVLTVTVGVAGVVAACSDALSVPNQNNPGTDQVLKRPADVEQLLGTGYNTVHQGTLGTAVVVSGAGGNDNVQTQLQVMALENYSSLANFGMGPRGGLPRNPVQNYRNNPVAAGNFRDFSTLERAARSAADGIAKFNDPTFTTGDTARDLRARAFGYFVMGTALGNLALVYDSLAVTSPATPAGEITPLIGYADGMKAALLYLDTAVVIASRPGAAGSFGASWVNGVSLDQAGFVRLVRSYRARFRAGVARTPAERKAADWTQIIADAENGIKADVNVSMDPSVGWAMAWPIQHNSYGSWHQMTPYIIGMADTSHAGNTALKTINFNEWLAQPIAAKTPKDFLIRTPDSRFPPGNTRVAQNDGSGGTASKVVPPNGQYFRNRDVGSDVFDNTWGNSAYDFVRFRAFFNANRIGPYPVMTRAEMRLLSAEGYIYKGNFAAAAVKIDSSRTANQLPSVAGIADLVTPVPGGVYVADTATARKGKAILVSAAPGAANCVPRVPVAGGGTACGNIFEALKWEKRIETAYTGYGAWYFDSRGWGDLPEGTALSFPVPYQELDARAKPAYALGGLGGSAAAPKGTYGY